jgi:hypothetical protein
VATSARIFRNRRLPLALALIVWTALVTAGLAGLTRYAMTPGAPPRSTRDWPSGVAFHPTDRELTLVITIHAQCPCSRATIAELAKLLTRHREQIGVCALLVQFDSNQEYADALRRLPAVTVIQDNAGAVSEQFGSQTSGQTFAFDRAGHLLFSGGITASRGHEGDNAGTDVIEAILSGHSTNARSTPVFGCALTDRSERR